MKYGFRAVALLFASFLASACNPVAAELKDQILGRWDSTEWKNVYVQFNPDGTVEHSRGFHAKWLILESGSVQITYPSGATGRCKITVDNKMMTIDPAGCLASWDYYGEKTVLAKQ